MTPRQQAQIREDFEAWSGGFPPSDQDQIFTYVTYAMAVEGVSEDEATEYLLLNVGEWLT